MYYTLHDWCTDFVTQLRRKCPQLLILKQAAIKYNGADLLMCLHPDLVANMAHFWCKICYYILDTFVPQLVCVLDTPCA